MCNRHLYRLRLLQRPKCAAARHDENTPGLIYHVVQVSVWEKAMSSGTMYLPPTYKQDGFIHATHDGNLLIDVLNYFYKDVTSDFMCLELDTSTLASPVRMEAAASVGDKQCGGLTIEAKLPHIYGAIQPTSCITRQLPVVRGLDGTFISIDGLASPSPTSNAASLASLSDAAYSPREEELKHLSRVKAGGSSQEDEGNRTF